MTVAIRLRRNKKKNDPAFQIVVIDSRTKRDGAYIEKIGHYKPDSKQYPKFEMKLDRAKHWISKGAQPSERVAKFIKIQETGVHYQKPQKTAAEEFKIETQTIHSDHNSAPVEEPVINPTEVQEENI